tara:strand:+ start:107 stop:1387 length:1281 start_codon:yes stop_codon:yes gene_type:complete
MFTNTRSLIKNHGGLIAICFLLLFFSVFGQSLFFGLYLPDIQADLDLTKTSLGLLYACATVLSSIVVIYSAKKLDVWPLRIFVAFTLVGLAVGCFAMSLSYTLPGLFLAFFLLRHFGQGLMTISSNATINRYLTENRGKATALRGLGAPLQLVVFPFLVYAIADYIDWRTAWLYYGAFILLVLLPSFWYFLKSHQRTTHAKWAADMKQAEADAKAAADAQAENGKPVKAALLNWSVADVLKDWRIYGLIAISFISPFTGTVIFFYQADVAASLDLTPLGFATAFPFLTIAMVLSSLGTGGVIDSYGEKPALVSYPIIYGLGLFVLTQSVNMLTLYAAMTLIGIGSGIMMTTGGPLLANLYGTKYLSSVKSLVFSSAIVASAISPFLFGYLMDQGVDILNIFLGVVAYSAVIWVVAIPLCSVEKYRG